jgi:hypothetical protein
MALATTAIAIEFCISANVLTWAGVPYVTEGGVFPEKINPGTYLLCLAYAANVARQDRPNRALWSAFGGDPRLALYFSCLFSCLAYALLTTGTGNIIVLLDTFLPAGLLASIIRDATAQELRCLLAVFRCGICGNALLGLGEAMAHATLAALSLSRNLFRGTAFFWWPGCAGSGGDERHPLV